MRLKKYGLLFCLLFPALLFAIKAQAQRTLIDVKIDTADILIGEQTTLHLTITTDNGNEVYWPIADTLMTGVEVLSLSTPDSTVIDNNKLVIKQDILITSFDSALYFLPPFMAIDKTDTVYSNQIALKVSTVPVNTDAPEEYFDIKDVWKPPFVLADYYPLIFGVLLTCILIYVVWYIIQRLRKKKTWISFKKEEPELPPHEEAIRELDKIKQSKLWQQGKNKEYHTQVTDTLRHYITRRFGFNAMEMTSFEILNMIRQESDAQPVYEILKQILHLADFVKFAKLHPLPNENDLSMGNAYLFVNQTKLVEITKPTENAEINDPEGKTSDLNLKVKEE
jgi:hypothetical protein